MCVCVCVCECVCVCMCVCVRVCVRVCEVRHTKMYHLIDVLHSATTERKTIMNKPLPLEDHGPNNLYTTFMSFRWTDITTIITVTSVHLVHTRKHDCSCMPLASSLSCQLTWPTCMSSTVVNLGWPQYLPANYHCKKRLLYQ